MLRQLSPSPRKPRGSRWSGLRRRDCSPRKPRDAASVGQPGSGSLTAAGHARFPDTHAELTVRLIDADADTNWARQRSIASSVSASGDPPRLPRAPWTELPRWPTRVARLAEIRAREGYMAEWRADARRVSAAGEPLPDLRRGDRLPGLLPLPSWRCSVTCWAREPWSSGPSTSSPARGAAPIASRASSHRQDRRHGHDLDRRAPSAELEAKGKTVVRHDGRQILCCCMPSAASSPAPTAVRTRAIR